jgi:hypothetical protein
MCWTSLLVAVGSLVVQGRLPQGRLHMVVEVQEAGTAPLAFMVAEVAVDRRFP